MSPTDPISAAHRLACRALDLAHGHGDDRLLAHLQSATIHLWMALKSSDDTTTRLNAAEDELREAIEYADGDLGATIRSVLGHLRGVRSGGVA